MLFGSIGIVETFLVNIEQAAIGAIQAVFPEVTVKDCTFHFFHQAVTRHLQQSFGRRMSPRLNIQMYVYGC